MLSKTLRLVAVIGGVFLLHLCAVRANSLPAPDIWWFTFDVGASEPHRLKGLQVIGCETTSCEQPTVLQQFGSCSAPDCLSSEPTLAPSSSGANWLKCAGDRCRFANYYAYQSKEPYGTQFRLVAQFSDRARVSDVVETPRERLDDNLVAWRVAVEDDALALTLDTSEKAGISPWERLRGWLRSGYGYSGLFFTQFVELPVAALCLGFWFGEHGASSAVKGAALRLAKPALMVFMINLVTFPIVWLFFPSLGRFQPTHVRVLGIAGLVLAVFYGALLVAIYTTEKGRKKSTRLLTLVSLPLALLSAVAIWGLVAYGASYQVAAMGLPAAAIVPIAELFAVLCEAALLTVLLKRALLLWQVGVTSLLMNAASFFLSLWVLGIWP